MKLVQKIIRFPWSVLLVVTGMFIGFYILVIKRSHDVADMVANPDAVLDPYKKYFPEHSVFYQYYFDYIFSVILWILILKPLIHV